MNKQITDALLFLIRFSPLWFPMASAAEYTKCMATSAGDRWLIVNGQESNERCVALAKQCTGNPGAVVQYSSVPVLFTGNYKRCISFLPSATADPTSKGATPTKQRAPRAQSCLPQDDIACMARRVGERVKRNDCTLSSDEIYEISEHWDFGTLPNFVSNMHTSSITYNSKCNFDLINRVLPLPPSASRFGGYFSLLSQNLPANRTPDMAVWVADLVAVGEPVNMLLWGAAQKCKSNQRASTAAFQALLKGADLQYQHTATQPKVVDMLSQNCPKVLKMLAQARAPRASRGASIIPEAPLTAPTLNLPPPQPGASAVRPGRTR